MKLVKLQVVLVDILPRQMVQRGLKATVQLASLPRVAVVLPHLVLVGPVEVEKSLLVTRTSPTRGPCFRGRTVELGIHCLAHRRSTGAVPDVAVDQA